MSVNEFQNPKGGVVDVVLGFGSSSEIGVWMVSLRSPRPALARLATGTPARQQRGCFYLGRASIRFPKAGPWLAACPGPAGYHTCLGIDKTYFRCPGRRPPVATLRYAKRRGGLYSEGASVRLAAKTPGPDLRGGLFLGRACMRPSGDL